MRGSDQKYHMGEGESMMAPKQSNEAFVLVQAALLVLPKNHIE